MLNSFSQKLSCNSTNHHCGHYSSFIKDFVVTDENNQPIPNIEAALGNDPYGKWPMVVPLYSRTCPIVATYFSEIDHYLKTYLQTNELRVLGMATSSLRKSANETHHYMALFFGRSASPDIICTDKNCTGASCEYSTNMDIYARSIHNQHL